MAQTFQRLNGPESSLTSGQWTPQTESGRPSLCCPACSYVFALPQGIDCNEAGLTNYCITCTAPHCGWWSYAVLDNRWEP